MREKANQVRQITDLCKGLPDDALNLIMGFAQGLAAATRLTQEAGSDGK